MTIKVKKMVETLFPDTSSQGIREVVNIVSTYGMNYGLNTPIRLAHFLAQVRQEVGTEFKPLRESMNYSAKGLQQFKIFRENPSLVEMYARTDIHPANQEMIANLAYANRMGNGSVDTGDGWKYRGAGVLQITGKENFQMVQDRINKYSPRMGIDILTGKSADSLLGSILMGMAYWIWKDLYKVADKGDTNEVVDKITSIINLHSDSYPLRVEHFNKIKHLI